MVLVRARAHIALCRLLLLLFVASVRAASASAASLSYRFAFSCQTSSRWIGRLLEAARLELTSVPEIISSSSSVEHETNIIEGIHSIRHKWLGKLKFTDS